MTNIFNILVSAVGQLNQINTKYNQASNPVLSSQLPESPPFITASVGRMCSSSSDDENAINTISIDYIFKANTGDAYTKLYIVLVSDRDNDPVKSQNIDVKIDKIPIIATHDNEDNPGIAIIMIVPTFIFNGDSDDFSKYLINKLFDFYGKLISIDPNMTYDSSTEFLDILKFSEDKRVNMYTYDLYMVLICLGCIYINLRSWYSDITPDYILDEIPGLADNVKEPIYDALKVQALSISQLREGIKSGKFIAECLGY